MQGSRNAILRFCFAMTPCVFLPAGLLAQGQDGPQSTPPAADAIAPRPAPTPVSPPRPSEKIVVPSGTRLSVILENGISTRGAKPGDSVYFQTNFPIAQNNRIVVPVGSYLRGEIIDAKRPGKIKGQGQFRLRLNTLILPNGYTVNLNATPKGADSGGKETIDSEGKITGPSGKGKDAGTVLTTTATGAGIGAIAGRGAQGAGIGAGIGAAAGLAAILLTRGPEAELPRGSTMDIELEHDLYLDADQIPYSNLQPSPPRVVYPPLRRPEH